MYGNGGIKCWPKDFVLKMRTHENADPKNAHAQVDFCWDINYIQMDSCMSDVHNNATPQQAWRAGFREGVKMTLLDGVKVPPQEIQERIWWHNIHRLRMWSTVGAHEENGIYAVYGARLGTWMANCTQWNYVDVRDFEILRDIYFQYGKPYEDVSGTGLREEIENLGEKIKMGLGLDWPFLDAQQSKFTLDLYNETMNLNDTYFKMPVPTNV